MHIHIYIYNNYILLLISVTPYTQTPAETQSGSGIIEIKIDNILKTLYVQIWNHTNSHKTNSKIFLPTYKQP